METREVRSFEYKARGTDWCEGRSEGKGRRGRAQEGARESFPAGVTGGTEAGLD